MKIPYLHHNMLEKWKIHSSGYWVSSEGRIKGKNVEYLAQPLNSYGYPIVCLGKISSNKAVHRMVCETFIGKIPIGFTVNHKNGIKTDNRLSNLEVITHRDNVIHAYKNGLKFGSKGEKAANIITTEKQVIKIYDAIKSGKRNIDISKEFGITHKHVSMLRTGRRWGHLYKKYFTS